MFGPTNRGLMQAKTRVPSRAGRINAVVSLCALGIAFTIGHYCRRIVMAAPAAFDLTAHSSVAVEGSNRGAVGRSLMENHGGKVLIVYLFSNTDPVHEDNFHFFTREGCFASDSVDYVFVLAIGDGTQPLRQPLPNLPPNARIIFRENKCNDWGVFGWVLQHADVDKSVYKHFIFMTSKVRGPFMPTYVNERGTWISALLSKITQDVKLVGTIVACDKWALSDSDPSGPHRRNPYIQSSLVATDQVGLRLLENDGRVLSCHSAHDDALFFSDLGSSLAILDGGYNIDCLLTKFQGIEWRDTSTWVCDDDHNPYRAFVFDEKNLHPLEVMFSSVDSLSLADPEHPATYASKYSRWMSEQRRSGQVTDVSTNAMRDLWDVHLATKLLVRAWRTRECWDIDYYRQRNHDLPDGWRDDEMVDHFTCCGLMELRPVRYNCTDAWPVLEAHAAQLKRELTRIALSDKREALPRRSKRPRYKTAPN